MPTVPFPSQGEMYGCPHLPPADGGTVGLPRRASSSGGGSVGWGPSARLPCGVVFGPWGEGTVRGAAPGETIFLPPKEETVGSGPWVTSAPLSPFL